MNDKAKLAGTGPKGLGFATLSSVGVALLSSVGINFVDYTPYLLPTVALFLAIALSALAYRAAASRGYGPFWLGVLGALGILAGRFIFESKPGLYLGAGLLVGADPTVAARARTLGIDSVPAIAIDGQLADCCAGRGVDEETLRQAGVGQPLN